MLPQNVIIVEVQKMKKMLLEFEYFAFKNKYEKLPRENILRMKVNT